MMEYGRSARSERMQDADRERQDGEESSLMAGSLLMDDDESGNEEEKPAFWEGGKVGTQGRDTRLITSWTPDKN